MRLAVVGTGYVGLVAGACFADSGHEVICVDSDADKIERLRRGEIPIYEEGLADIVGRCSRSGRLSFTTDLPSAVADAAAVFVAVGTPARADGEADLSSVFNVVRSVVQHVTQPTLLVLKSTVPVGTNARVSAVIAEERSRLGVVAASEWESESESVSDSETETESVSDSETETESESEADQAPVPIEVVSNPEFLKEGAAIADFRRPNRVVLGVRSEGAARIMRELYAPFVRTGAPILVMSPESAELTKYAANAMLASRIAFMNDVAALCEKVGADVDAVRLGVGSDHRIGPTFLFPGAGYGGSCFPKDVRSLAATARAQDSPSALFEEIEKSNERQKRLLGSKIARAFEALGGLGGKTIALWGLAFKPGTDDMREAPSLVLIEDLVYRGARVRAHDPVALDRAADVLTGEIANGAVTLFSEMYDAARGTDALVLITDWGDYRRPDLVRLRETLTNPWVFDGRNVWDPQTFIDSGFVYEGIGRPAPFSVRGEAEQPNISSEAVTPIERAGTGVDSSHDRKTAEDEEAAFEQRRTRAGAL